MKETETIYKLEYPIFSFDFYKEKLIVFIYQMDGIGKLSVRNLTTKEEIHFVDLGSSSINLWVKFIDSKKIAYFDGSKVFINQLDNKRTQCVRDGLDDSTMDEDKLVMLSKKGEILILDLLNCKEDWVSNIKPYIPFREINTIKLIDYRSGRGLIAVLNNNNLLLFENKNKNKALEPYELKNGLPKELLSNNTSEFIAIISKRKNGLTLLRLVENNLAELNFLNVMNCSSINFVTDSFLLIGSNIGYLTIVELSSQNLIYNNKIHNRSIRQIVVKNNSDIYTAGDDGEILKLILDII